MTYRVYVRLGSPSQKVVAKTTTDDEAVAKFAWQRIEEEIDKYLSMGAIGVAMTQDNKQVQYLDLVALSDTGNSQSDSSKHGPGDR